MQPEVATVVDLVARAGAALRARHRGALAVEYKGPRDLVTAADRESEAILLEGLRAAFPGDAIHSEESGLEGTTDGRCWYLDPLDGTTNFAAGHPLFAISAGLWEGARPLLAVVHVPLLEEMFWARAGDGAFLNGERLHVSTEPDLANTLLATGFSYGRAEMREGGLELFGRLLERAREIRRAGVAAIDMAYTALGVFGGFWEYHLHPHDVAAGALLVREAGGVVTDVSGGEDFLDGRSIVAGNPAIHRELLREVRDGPRHPGAPSSGERS